MGCIPYLIMRQLGPLAVLVTDFVKNAIGLAKTTDTLQEHGTAGIQRRFIRLMDDTYVVVLAGFGAVVLLTAWLPMLLKELPLSLPIVCVTLGVVLFSIPQVPGVAPHP